MFHGASGAQAARNSFRASEPQAEPSRNSDQGNRGEQWVLKGEAGGPSPSNDAHTDQRVSSRVLPTWMHPNVPFLPLAEFSRGVGHVNTDMACSDLEMQAR